MRNFEPRIATQTVVRSAKWRQTRSPSRTHSSANPRANNTPNLTNILRRRHRTPNLVNYNQHSNRRISTGGPSKWRALHPPRVHQASHACAHHLRGRTTLSETSPWSQRPRSGAPKQPAPHDGPAPTVTSTHSDSTGGVAPRIPTLAGPSDPENSTSVFV